MFGLLDHKCTDACHKTTPTLIAGDNQIGNYIACPACERGDPDCKRCDGWGLLRIEGCPYRYVGDEAFELIEAADLIEKTGWPRGGGWAKEPAALVDGVQRVWTEFQRIKNELSKGK